MNYVPRGGKGFSVAIKLVYIRCKLVIMAHLSTYKLYTYALTIEVIDGYPSFPICNHAQILVKVTKEEGGVTKCCLLIFDITVVLLTIMKGIRPSKLYTNYYISNKNYKWYQ